jgi:hypothetical protein
VRVSQFSPSFSLSRTSVKSRWVPLNCVRGAQNVSHELLTWFRAASFNPSDQPIIIVFNNHHSLPSPCITSLTSLSASTAKATMLPSLSELPVETSLVTVSLPSRATARATYPGVRFLVLPPVGPAVPLSLIAYVLPNLLRVCSARPETIVGVGPL